MSLGKICFSVTQIQIDDFIEGLSNLFESGYGDAEKRQLRAYFDSFWQLDCEPENNTFWRKRKEKCYMLIVNGHSFGKKHRVKISINSLEKDMYFVIICSDEEWFQGLYSSANIEQN